MTRLTMLVLENARLLRLSTSIVVFLKTFCDKETFCAKVNRQKQDEAEYSILYP